MEVKALTRIVRNDSKGVIEAGEVFECSKERFKVLSEFGKVEAVVKPVAEKKEKAKVSTKEEKSTKKDK